MGHFECTVGKALNSCPPSLPNNLVSKCINRGIHENGSGDVVSAVCYTIN